MQSVVMTVTTTLLVSIIANERQPQLNVYLAPVLSLINQHFTMFF